MSPRLVINELMTISRALNASPQDNTSLTYASAGVSVDNGNSLVNVIKPYVKATRRVGADADIGGFGGVFDIKALNYQDPILVSGTDGVGTKLRVAIEAGVHDTVGGFHSYFSRLYLTPAPFYPNQVLTW